MRYKLLGKSGLRVSELCLGTMTFGKDWGWGADRDVSQQIYTSFLDAGGNFVDTADFYTNGTSETYLGEFMTGHRDQIVLSTKYTNNKPGKDPNAAGNHRKNMIQSVEASLKRLKTDYIDLYWLHAWDNTTPIEEVMRAFDDLVRQGKVLYIGISDTPAWEISRANMLSELRGWTSFVGVQVEYNLAQRTIEWEYLPMARKLDIGVIAWGPLASGLLSGKYKVTKDGSVEGDGRLAKSKSHSNFDDRKIRISKTVSEIANELGRSSAQVALSWIRQQAGIIIPTIGASKASQLADNIACVDLVLEKPHLDKLDEVSRIPSIFPYSFLHNERTRQDAFGGLAHQIDNHRDIY